MDKFRVQEMVDSLKIGEPQQIEAPDERTAAEKVAGDKLSAEGTPDQLSAQVRRETEDGGTKRFFDPRLPSGDETD